MRGQRASPINVLNAYEVVVIGSPFISSFWFGLQITKAHEKDVPLKLCIVCCIFSIKIIQVILLLVHHIFSLSHNLLLQKIDPQ